MSGAPCFAGTRVPIQNLIDYLEGGDSIEDFLEGFPSVSREQVIAFLEEAKECMLAAATKWRLKLARFPTHCRYPRDFTFYVADPISPILLDECVDVAAAVSAAIG